MTQSIKPVSGPEGRAPLSPLIHGRVRLLILSLLLRSRQACSFTSLRSELGLTDGSLSVHISKLEAGDLVSVEKTFEGKRPLTRVKVSPKGRRQFRRYVSELKSIVPGLNDIK